MSMKERCFPGEFSVPLPLTRDRRSWPNNQSLQTLAPKRGRPIVNALSDPHQHLYRNLLKFGIVYPCYNWGQGGSDGS